MTIKEFADKFRQIKELGYIPTKRRGSTGIGYTLETLLGIPENNNAHPDIEGAELKAHRTNGNSMITLFTFNSKAWKMPPLEAVKRYGSFDKNGRQGLYYTISLKPNSAGLFLDVQKTEIAVRHISGEAIAVWQLQTIADRFMQKLPALLFVSTFTEERDGVEYFRYYRAQLMKGTSPTLLADQLRAENVLVDLRLHGKGTIVRNHGTGFRTYEDKLPLLFNNIADL
ncbi:MAG: MvaI/BcnI family restriction endonuclease [Prevotellaceae bacterium]|jgi:hypothetical protein|nr:MvaI/BcnI family restriction endonuclease [Prevotellaceae bacterium]